MVVFFCFFLYFGCEGFSGFNYPLVGSPYIFAKARENILPFARVFKRRPHTLKEDSSFARHINTNNNFDNDCALLLFVCVVFVGISALSS